MGSMLGGGGGGGGGLFGGQQQPAAMPPLVLPDLPAPPTAPAAVAPPPVAADASVQGGDELTRAIRQQRPLMPTILTSSTGMGDARNVTTQKQRLLGA